MNSFLKKVTECPLFFLIALQFLFFAFFVFLLEKFQIISLESILKAFVSFDASWYNGIANNDYTFTQQTKFPAEAFFPLFPLLWKWIHATPYTICIVNLILYGLGLEILDKFLKFSSIEKLLILSFPSVIFCFLPFSEALFFFSCSILLYGIKNNKIGITILGILLSGTTRSTAMLLLPAYFLIEFSQFYEQFVSISMKKKIAQLSFIKKISIAKYQINNIEISSSKKNYLNTFFYHLAFSVMAILITAVLQKIYGCQKWFYFFKAQKEWGKRLRIPFPLLNSWTEPALILDLFSFLIFILSLLFFIIFILLTIKNIKTIVLEKTTIFSLSYIICISIITIFLAYAKLVDIHSLNRYIIATPFFVIFIIHCFRNYNFNKKLQKYGIIIILFLVGISWFPISLNRLVTLLLFIGYSIFSLQVLFNSSFKKSNYLNLY